MPVEAGQLFDGAGNEWPGWRIASFTGSPAWSSSLAPAEIRRTRDGIEPHASCGPLVAKEARRDRGASMYA